MVSPVVSPPLLQLSVYYEEDSEGHVSRIERKAERFTQWPRCDLFSPRADLEWECKPYSFGRHRSDSSTPSDGADRESIGILSKRHTPFTYWGGNLKKVFMISYPSSQSVTCATLPSGTCDTLPAKGGVFYVCGSVSLCSHNYNRPPPPP